MGCLGWGGGGCNFIHETLFLLIGMAKDVKQNEGEENFTSYDLKYLYCSKYSNVTLPAKEHLRIVLQKKAFKCKLKRKHFKNLVIYIGTLVT